MSSESLILAASDVGRKIHIFFGGSFFLCLLGPPLGALEATDQ